MNYIVYGAYNPCIFWLFKSFSENMYTRLLLIILYLDIHAHSTLMNGFMYGNVYDDNDRFEKQAVFPKLLCNNAEDFSLVMYLL